MDKVVDAPVMQVVQVSRVFDIPVVDAEADPHDQAVQRITEIPQSLFDKVVDVPVVWVMQVLR